MPQTVKVFSSILLNKMYLNIDQSYDQEIKIRIQLLEIASGASETFCICINICGLFCKIPALITCLIFYLH